MAVASQLAQGIVQTASALGMDPVDLGTIISYETAGTFDPAKPGPRTKWGQHKGLIQFGEPQARQYGVNWDDPVGSQLGENGAIVRYFRENGWQPGMSLLDAYSIVNAGAPGRYNASDTAAGGAPGTVRDKVTGQMAAHRRKAESLLTQMAQSGQTMNDASSSGAQATGGPRVPRELLLQEAQRRGLLPQTAGATPQTAGRPSREALMQEAQRRGLLPPQGAPQQPQGPAFEAGGRMGAQQPPQPPRSGVGGVVDAGREMMGGMGFGLPLPTSNAMVEGLGRLGAGMTEAAGTMVNDMNAGFQRVNPVSVAQSSPIGIVRSREDGGASIESDGTIWEIPQEKFGGYVTRLDPETGQELIYERTPEMAESPLASAGRVVGYGIPGEIANVGRAAMGPSKSARRAQDAADLGVTPSLGMGGPTRARLAAVGESAYPTAGVVAKDAERAVTELGQAAARTADSVGPGAGREEAGAALISGANDFVLKNLKGSDEVASRSQRLFNRVDRYIPADTRVQADSTAGLLKGFLDRFKDAPNIGKAVGDTKWQGWLDDIAANGGSLSWQQAKELRTVIGKQIGAFTGPLSDAAEGQVKAIYRSLTSDMEAAARAAGEPALKAWKRANEYHKQASETVSEALDVIFKAKGDEQAYENVLALTKDKTGRANVAKLEKIKNSLPAEDWSVLVGTVVRRMGEGKDGFSPSTFLTEWGKMSDKAKDILFKGKGVPPNLRSELDKIANVAERAKKAEQQINNSRSGTVGGNLAAISAFALDPVTTTTVAVVSHLTARVVTHPPVLRAMRSFAVTGGSAASQARLEAMKKQFPALAPEISAVLRLETQRSAQPGAQAAPAPAF